MAIRTTAILNLKGGVAKTTTAINMAAILAEKYKHRVLLIDADSQCNTTEFFGGKTDEETLASLLRYSGKRELDEELVRAAIQATEFDGISLIPGDESLMDMDLSAAAQGTVDANVLRALIEIVKGWYDFVLIDCPPAFNAASAAALVAADDVVIPIKLDAFSLRGMANLMRQIRNMRKINPRLKVAGLLPTMWYKDQQIQDAEEQLRAAGLRVFPHIRRSDKVDKMTFQQDPLLISSPNSAAGVDYRKFVVEYVGGVK